MHDYAQLLHMHTVSVCDSNFLCSCVFVRQEISFVQTDVNDEPDLASLWHAKKYVHVLLHVCVCHTTQRAQRGFTWLALLL